MLVTPQHRSHIRNSILVLQCYQGLMGRSGAPWGCWLRQRVTTKTQSCISGARGCKEEPCALENILHPSKMGQGMA